jgi:glycosyltransferase involved in cell wall biosynthesis
MSEKLRVALGTIYPYNEDRVRGGVEAVALYLTRALAKRDDIELHVVSCNRTIQRSFSERRGSVTFHWLASGSRLHTLRAATIEAWRVRRIYARIRPDVIHAQGFSEYAIGAPEDIPLVLTVHGLELLSPRMQHVAHFRGLLGIYRQKLGKYIVKKSVRKATAIISIAGDYVPGMLKAWLNRQLVYHIFNPVDDSWFSVPDKSHCNDLVLFVGGISERKNLIDLLKAFAQVAQKLPKAKLQLIGDIKEPSYWSRVQQEIGRLKLGDKVRFEGGIDQARLLEAYAQAAVVVLASLEETAPMVLAQALAAGKPVVATKVGGIPSLVKDGVTGYLVEVGDTESMAERMIELLQDKSKRQHMGQTAREIAYEQFSADAVVTATLQVYRDLLEQRRSYDG